MQTKKSGNWGESFACNYLKTKGYRIIDRNFRTPYGEIDIVALYKNTLIFVEVKTRLSTKYGKPEEAVTSQKIKKIERVGDYYCSIHKNLPLKKRIDVVAIEIKDKKVRSVKLISAI